MDRAIAIDRLKANEAEFRRLGVDHLYLFGSTARGAARPGSDVDLFIDHAEGSLGLFALMTVKAFATEVLGHHADLMTRRGLHPLLRPGIEAEASRIF